MIILGIDPGYSRIGWGVIESHHGNSEAIAYDCISTPINESGERRLFILREKLVKIIDRYHPDQVAVEKLFFATNAKTAIAVGQARGVILVTIAEQKIPLADYTPLQIKQTVTGSGKADKKQVSRMVTTLLHLTQVPNLDDTSDALAIALTHAAMYKMKARIL